MLPKCKESMQCSELNTLRLECSREKGAAWKKAEQQKTGSPPTKHQTKISNQGAASTGRELPSEDLLTPRSIILWFSALWQCTTSLFNIFLLCSTFRPWKEDRNEPLLFSSVCTLFCNLLVDVRHIPPTQQPRIARLTTGNRQWSIRIHRNRPSDIEIVSLRLWISWSLRANTDLSRGKDTYTQTKSE